jgi:hypothetical protein
VPVRPAASLELLKPPPRFTIVPGVPELSENVVNASKID